MSADSSRASEAPLRREPLLQARRATLRYLPWIDAVSEIGLEQAPDRELLDRAAEDGYIVVSKDEDLHQLAILHGPPPKVVWVRLGNCTTSEAEVALRAGIERIDSLAADEDATFLVLGRPSG